MPRKAQAILQMFLSQMSELGLCLIPAIFVLVGEMKNPYPPDCDVFFFQIPFLQNLTSPIFINFQRLCYEAHLNL